jgi:hypothetical protein
MADGVHRPVRHRGGGRILGDMVTVSPGASGPHGPRRKAAPAIGTAFANTVSTHVAQKVHSKLQIRAWVEAGGSAALQCSQGGLSSSMVTPGFLT